MIISAKDIVPGTTVGDLITTARDKKKVAGGTWRIFVNNEEIGDVPNDTEIQCNASDTIKVVPGLLKEDMIKSIAVAGSDIVDLAYATKPFVIGGVLDMLTGPPRLIYNPITGEEFILVLHKSGDYMHMLTTDGGQTSETVEQSYQHHMALHSSLLYLAAKYPGTSGAPRRLRVINLDGREVGVKDPDASRRKHLEKTALDDVYAKLRWYGGYQKSPWPTPQYYYCPIPDFESGDVETIKFIMSTVRRWGNNDLVTVHCSSSLGRTGGIVMAIIAGLNASLLAPSLDPNEKEATEAMISSAADTLYDEPNDEMMSLKRPEIAVGLAVKQYPNYNLSPAKRKGPSPVPTHTGRPIGGTLRGPTVLEKENIQIANGYEQFNILKSGDEKYIAFFHFIIRVVSSRQYRGRISRASKETEGNPIGEITYWGKKGHGPECSIASIFNDNARHIQNIVIMLGLKPDLEQCIAESGWIPPPIRSAEPIPELPQRPHKQRRIAEEEKGSIIL